MSASSSSSSSGQRVEHVPVLHSLSDIYADAVKAQQRYSALTAQFLRLYGCVPTFYARAPGRVNLIGEHVDYSGYSVLPMAIERDTVVAAAILQTPSAAASDPHPVQLANYDAAYPALTYNNSRQLFTIQQSHSWSKYVQCGFKGVFAAVRAADAKGGGEGKDDFVGYSHHALQLLVNGTVPPSAGLSSSSSLVCVSALTAAFAHGFHSRFSRRELADISSRCERYVGTMGGGMDQAISFLSERGVAQRIDFDPLVNTAVQLPHDAVFVVCNSLFESEKAVQAARQFNARVLECKLAAMLLAQHFQIAVRDGQLQTLTLKKVQLSSGLSCSQMVELLSSASSPLHHFSYTALEVETLLSVSLSSSLAYNPNFAKVLASPPPLQLHLRALHVYSEAQRVFDFQAECSGQARVSELGRLMDESHASCRDNYACSCDDLEQLVRACKEAGARGCRLTGAGWGGCAVALFDSAVGGSSGVDDAIARIRSSYYLQHKGIALDDPRLSDYIFTSTPASGAAIYVPEGMQAAAAAGGAGRSWDGEWSWAGMLRRFGLMLGLGVATGLVMVLLSRRSRRQLAHATGMASGHAVASGAVDSAALTPHTLPVIR